ncbi:MAG: hypothetical protein C4617_05045 [Candidatus Liberibacter europaeus]|uniref:DUF488 domain-containing protein n=1 Tax=Candidatus Liberibacter europaeus TaxID=744859 RepID=A0A2T4VWH3_9HYPH|nr:hypothetical protein [Candidatus Liberibacter europaeus]PTL86134.1 MAG: hypothetical protein C4617_05045 [Candidatus Liberibacter europaeus]
MNANELSLIASARKRPNTPCLFTIGYEGSSFEEYLNRIIKNNIKMLVDVRKNPISRKRGFSKKNLSETLNNLGIKYVHIPNLGISSEKRQSLNTQKDYDLLFVSYLNNELKNNKSSLDYLFEIFKEYHRIAITCFEADKCMCHRGIIANALSNFPDWKYEICHI